MQSDIDRLRWPYLVAIFVLIYLALALDPFLKGSVINEIIVSSIIFLVIFFCIAKIFGGANWRAILGLAKPSLPIKTTIAFVIVVYVVVELYAAGALYILAHLAPWAEHTASKWKVCG
jgi:hypothetical protein